MKLRWKYFLVLVAASLVPLLTVTWISQNAFRRLGETISERAQNDLTEMISQEMVRATRNYSDIINMGGFAAEQVLRRLAARAELALALARIVGRERGFVRLWRRTGEELGTAASRAVDSIRRKLGKLPLGDEAAVGLAHECSEAFAQDDLRRAAQALGDLIGRLPLDPLEGPAKAILADCRRGLTQHGPERREYLILALYTIDAAVGSLRGAPPNS